MRKQKRQILPRLFVGSSTEQIEVARIINDYLDDVCDPSPWQDGFPVSSYNMQSLTEHVRKSDFAVMVLTPDDAGKKRNEHITVPRDNVVLELGLFIGGIGVERTFMVVDKHVSLGLPTDLWGITYLTFDSGRDLRTVLRKPCHMIREAVTKLGRRAKHAASRLPSRVIIEAPSPAGVTATIELTRERQAYCFRKNRQLSCKEAVPWARAPKGASARVRSLRPLAGVS